MKPKVSCRKVASTISAKKPEHHRRDAGQQLDDGLEQLAQPPGRELRGEQRGRHARCGTATSMDTGVVFSVPMNSGIMLTFGTPDTAATDRPGGLPARFTWGRNIFERLASSRAWASRKSGSASLATKTMMSTSAAIPVKAISVMTPAMSFSRSCRRRAAGESRGAAMRFRETLLHDGLSIHPGAEPRVTIV